MESDATNARGMTEPMFSAPLPQLHSVFLLDGFIGAITAELMNLVQTSPISSTKTSSQHHCSAWHRTQYPKSWVAYERDTESRGRAVNWLCDKDMLS